MKSDLYQTVTDRIIAQLEAGALPWVQPWSAGAGAVVALPENATTRRAYSGVNVLLLWGAQQAGGYASAEWLTYKQAQGVGAQVRAGEKGTTVYYADRFVPAAEKAKPVSEQRAVFFLKAFTVFNVAQCDGIVARVPVAATEREQVDAAERVIVGTGARIVTGGAKAFYQPSADTVHLPPQVAYAVKADGSEGSQINYYRTAFHELGHWTGHESRLARQYGKRFGDTAYAREELVAEMSSAFVCASLGIVPTVRHADYIASWLAVLRSDNKAVFTAASAASKAAEFIMGRGVASLTEQAA